MKHILKKFKKNFNRCLICIIVFFLVGCGGPSAPPSKIHDLIKQVKYSPFFIDPKATGFKDIKKVAILPFVKRESVTDRLEKIGKYILVGKKDVTKIIGALKINRKSASILSNALLIGKKLGVDAVITGSTGLYDKVGSQSALFSIRLIQIKNEKIVWSFLLNSTDFSIPGRQNYGDEKTSLFDELTKRWKKHSNIKYGIVLPPAQVQPGFSNITVTIPSGGGQFNYEYLLFKSSTPKSKGENIAALKKKNQNETLIYIDKNVRPDKKYYYKYKAITDDKFLVPFSKEISAAVTLKPQIPTGIRASIDFIGKIALFWNIHSDSEVQGYNIYRSQNKNGPFTRLTTLQGKNTKSFIDGEKTVLLDNTQYFYKITAYYDRLHESEKSAIAFATTPDKPYPPSRFSATNGDVKSVTLTWDPTNDKYIKGYRIYRSTNPTGEDRQLLTEIKDTSQLTFTDENSFFKSNALRLSDGTTYYYQILSYNVINKESDLSQITTAATKPVPAKIVNLNTSVKTGQNEVILNWNLGKEKDLQEYIILRSTHEEGSFKKIGSVSSSQNSYSDSNLQDGYTYYYKIQAKDADDLYSDPSNPQKATIGYKR